MSVFTRFTDIINANLTALLDKAEHPEKMIRLMIQEMEETLVEVRSTAAKNLAEKKTLLRQQRQLEQQLAHWQQKATLAVEKGRDDLAKLALVEKHNVSKAIEQNEQLLAEIEQQLQVIQDDSARLQAKLSEAKHKQQALALRADSAKVRLKAKVHEYNYQVEETLARFEQYQQKIERLEADVDAYDLTANVDLAQQFQSLEQEQAVESELAKLKQAVNQ
jgi:phage shock protein A